MCQIVVYCNYLAECEDFKQDENCVRKDNSVCYSAFFEEMPLHQTIHTLPSRTGVYAIAIEDGKLLVVQQQKGPHIGKWDLPGGQIEFGETIEEALRRELLEEVNLTFATYELWDNLTAVTRGVDAQGAPYDLHQIALVYCVDGLSPADQKTSELPYAWVSLNQLDPEQASPFVQAIIQQFDF